MNQVKHLKKEPAPPVEIKLEEDQLLAILTAVLVAGKCFHEQTPQSVWEAIEIAAEIYDRVILRQDYTECWPDRNRD